MRPAAMPDARSAAMSDSSRAMDSRSPASSARPSAVSVLMSYQARMRMPMLSVTGRTGACGNTKRIPGFGGSFSSGTIGTKSWPSAPRPCSQITLAEAGVAGARTTASAVSWMRWVTGSAVLVLPVALLALGEPGDRRRESPLARRILLRVPEPVDVLAPLRRGEAFVSRARLRVLRERGDKIGGRLRRRLALLLPRWADAGDVEADGGLDRIQD